jgi:SAM-dependent methyltransferase
MATAMIVAMRYRTTGYGTELRTTFDEVAAVYDRARPDYPPALFDDLAELAGLVPGSRVVEMGCGTGKATRPLAERGYRITCVELGERLAAVARRTLAPFPDVRVETADFETWEPDRAEFDAVVAFTSFHWLSDAARFARPAALLRPGGALAVTAVQHVLPPNGDPLFLALQEDYEAVVPDDPHVRAGLPGAPEEVAGLADDLAASGRFRPAGQRRHLWDVVYDADAYVDVLSTYSGHIALEEAVRTELLERIRRRIAAAPGGTIRKTYLAVLDVGLRA